MTYQEYLTGIPVVAQPPAMPPPPGVDINSAIQADLARFGRNVQDIPRRINAPLRALNERISGPVDKWGFPLNPYLGNTFWRGETPTGSRFGEPLPGEAMSGPDLRREMQAVRNFGNWFLSGYANPPPGFRDMPRSTGAPFIPERNTQVIPGPPIPEATPYPRPPMLDFSSWLRTGERGPLPLDARRPGRYPAPYYTPMPEVYDARTSGGMLAGGGAESAATRQLWDKYNTEPIPTYALRPDFVTGDEGIT